MFFLIHNFRPVISDVSWKQSKVLSQFVLCVCAVNWTSVSVLLIVLRTGRYKWTSDYWVGWNVCCIEGWIAFCVSEIPVPHTKLYFSSVSQLSHLKIRRKSHKIDCYFCANIFYVARPLALNDESRHGSCRHWNSNCSTGNKTHVSK
jgi:hypothetical protein